MSDAERKRIVFNSFEFSPEEYDWSGIRTISDFTNLVEKILTDSIPAKADGYSIEPPSYSYGSSSIFKLSFWRYESEDELEKRLERNRKALERKIERDKETRNKKEKAERALLERLKKKYE